MYYLPPNYQQTINSSTNLNVTTTAAAAAASANRFYSSRLININNPNTNTNINTNNNNNTNDNSNLQQPATFFVRNSCENFSRPLFVANQNLLSTTNHHQQHHHPTASHHSRRDPSRVNLYQNYYYHSPSIQPHRQQQQGPQQQQQRSLPAINLNHQQNFLFPNTNRLVPLTASTFHQQLPRYSLPKKDLLLYFNFIMDRGNAFTCMKYTLILCNVFGFILAIFNALFGIGYPQEKWPGGYTGGQMAIFSLFVMAFTTIGYCGAQHHKGYLLIVYGIIIFFLLIGLVAICFIYNDSLAELMYNGYMITFAVVIFFLMLFAFFISYKISEHGSNKYLSTIIPTTTQQSQSHHQQQSSQRSTVRRNPSSTTSATPPTTTAINNCVDNRRHHPHHTVGYGSGTAGNTTTTTGGDGSSGSGGGGGGEGSAGSTNVNNPSANPCPVPGCNYGKIIS